MAEIWFRAQHALLEMLGRMVELNRTKKTILLLIMDAALCVVSVWIAFSLRLGAWDLWSPAIGTVIVVSLGAWLPVFAIRGVYRSVMRFVGSRTMINISFSCFLMALVLSAFLSSIR
jgi:FlaA1/EpsC-like NDP-sugar epimerase